jgi:HEAT repeat protein
MVAAQLANQDDVVGRLLAVGHLQEKRDDAAVARLGKVLNEDPFWAVRVAASKALRAIHSDAAFDTLTSSMTQSNARVRRQVVADVTAFYRPAAFEQAKRVIESEKNPDIIGTALSALAPLGTNVRATLVQHLNASSWRQHLSETAMTTMRAQSDPFYIEPLRDALERRKTEFPGRSLGIGLEALAYLSRDEDEKDGVREFIASFTNDPRQNVKVAALNALGSLRDERALPVLERFAGTQKNTSVQRAAERAVEAIRSGRKAPVEVGDLRRELQELQKQNRELRREFDAMKKKLDAGVTTPAPKTKK